VGLAITVAILGVLRSAVIQVGARLMDAVDPALVDQATACVAGVAGIEQVRELRIRWIGHTLRAEIDATVDPALTLAQAHDIAHHAEGHLLHDVRTLTAATILWGSRTSALLSLGGPLVFVDQTTENLSAPDHASDAR
jgi:divalent metal cation (Fe/Co/Zn/Cd) transporter